MNNGKVLYINSRNRAVDSLIMVAEMKGIPIDVERDETSGYELLKSGEYDLVIANLFAKSLNGYELVSRMKKDNINCGVILILENELEKHEDDLLGKGVFSFVKRSSSEIELLNHIYEFFNMKSGSESMSEKTLTSVDFQIEQEIIKKTKELKALNIKVEHLSKELEETRDRLHKKRKYLVNSERMISIGQMSASIVHEINNPLTAIVSLVCAISLESQDNKKVVKYNDMLSQNIERLRGLTQSILLFANPTRGETIECVDTNEAIDDLLAFYGYELRKKDIKFEKICANGLPYIDIPKIKTQQVILNILKNAIHAVKYESGTISIRTYKKDDDFVAVDVADNGYGISKEQLKDVFKPFFSTKNEKDGSGLGLFICKEILEQYNATISVQSALGRGTTVTINLPIRKSNTKA